MNSILSRLFLLIIIVCISAGCANVSSLPGGKKDKIPPRLLKTTPKDSLTNTTMKKLVLEFDEYITVSDASREVQISPILSIPLTVLGINKHVNVTIPDTLLQPNTTYRISFNNAIKDLHEGNTFPAYTYTFSTGAYFDSLSLNGKVIDAFTGLSDTGSVFISLYAATESDSAVVRHKPLYVTKAQGGGLFSFKGLPARTFRIYALKDANENLIYDGKGEKIAFNDNTVTPGDTLQPRILLRLFKEAVDTSMHSSDTASKNANNLFASRKSNSKEKQGLTYTVGVDTSNIKNRTVEIIKPLEITFNKLAVIKKERISLAFDTNSTTIPVDFTIRTDTANGFRLYVNTAWKEDAVYTLKILKGFAKDTAGSDAFPSRYTFRTKRDEDYGKLQINIPTKYYDRKYILFINTDKDTIYQKSITDTVVSLTRLQPAKYTLRIFVDANGNGAWDPGDLFKKIQPEVVIPYENTINLKSGWENVIDFEKPQKPKK